MSFYSVLKLLLQSFTFQSQRKNLKQKNLSKTSTENKVLPKQRGIIRLNIYIHFYCYTCKDGSEGSPDDKRVPEQP